MFSNFKIFVIGLVVIFTSLIWADNLFYEPRNLSKKYQKPPSFKEEEGVLRKRVVQINKHLLMEESQSPITLNLFKDTFVNLTSKNILNFKKDSPFISGSLEDGGHMQVSTFKDGSMIGEVHSKDGVYSISSIKDGNVLIKELDVSGFDFKCGAEKALGFSNSDFLSSKKNFNLNLKLQKSTRSQKQLYPTPQSQTEGVEEEKYIDLLVIYTKDTREIFGEDEKTSREEIERRIFHEINKTNQALIYNGENEFDNFFYDTETNSYKKRIRLTAIKEVDYLQNTENMRQDWLILQNRETDLGRFVNEVREQYRADFVHLVVPEPSTDRVRGVAGTYSKGSFDLIRDFCSYEDESLGNCFEGLVRRSDDFINRLCGARNRPEECIRNFETFGGWKRHAFSGISCFNERCRIRNTLTHEIGHNMGLFHDRYTHNNSEEPLSSSNFPVTNYGFGYVNQNALIQNRQFCQQTIMAPIQQCLDPQGIGGFGYDPSLVIRTPYFSDPNTLFTEGEGEEALSDPAGVHGDEFVLTNQGPANSKQAIKDVYDRFLTKFLPGDSCDPYLFGALFEDLKSKFSSDSIPNLQEQIFFKDQGVLIKIDGKAHNININLRDVPSVENKNCSPQIQSSNNLLSVSPFTAAPSQNVKNSNYHAAISIDQNPSESLRSFTVFISYPKYRGSGIEEEDTSFSIEIEQDIFVPSSIDSQDPASQPNQSDKDQDPPRPTPPFSHPFH